MDFSIRVCYTNFMIHSFDKLSFQILSVEESACEDGAFTVKARPYAALSFRAEGEAEFKIGDKRFSSKQGDIIFIPQNVPYQVRYKRSKCLVIHLKDCNYLSPEHFPLRHFSAYQILFEQALSDWKNGFRVNSVKSVFYNVLQMLDDENALADKGIHDDSFLRCVHYIQENFCNSDLSLDFLCKKFFISKATLQRKFQQYYHMSYIKFLTKLRFDKAFNMLSSGNETVAAVAYACGFNDEKYFSRAVKKHFGVPPTTIMK